MGRRGSGPEPAGGLVLVDKPAGWTSHDVVARTRRLAGTRRVGHAGTLDPMATGVLVCGVGRTTRLLTHLVRADKEYTATLRLGESTTTDDAEGEVLTGTGAGAPDGTAVDRAALVEAVRPLTGRIEQVPSAVSAIKVDGRRAYARVRDGEQVELAARAVEVTTFEVGRPRTARGVSGADVVDVDVRVVVSSGTYVRALARDLGAALGCGGHLTALRRTRVGPYGIDGARTLEQLEESFALLPLAQAARAAFGVRELSGQEATDLSHGRSIAPAEGAPGRPDAPVAAFAPDGALVALVHDERGRTRPSLVLAPA